MILLLKIFSLVKKHYILCIILSLFALFFFFPSDDSPDFIAIPMDNEGQVFAIVKNNPSTFRAVYHNLFAFFITPVVFYILIFYKIFHGI